MAFSDYHHRCTASGIVITFLQLALAYFLLCVSAFLFLASRFLFVFHLYIPCPCRGLLGYRNTNLCLHKLLLDFPLRKIYMAQRTVTRCLPFDLVWRGNHDLNSRSGNKALKLEDQTYLVSGSRSKNLADKENEFDVKGKGIVNKKQKAAILKRRRKAAALGHEKSSSVLVNNSPQSAITGGFQDDGSALACSNYNIGYLKSSNASYGQTKEIRSENLMHESENLGSEANTMKALEQALQEKANTIRALEQALQEEKATGIVYLKSNVSNGQINEIPSENLMHEGGSLRSEANRIKALEQALQGKENRIKASEQALQEEKAAGNVSNRRTNGISSENLVHEGESLGSEANQIKALEQALPEKENRIKASEQALQEEKAADVGYLKSNASQGRTYDISSENLMHEGESLGSEANTIKALELALQEKENRTKASEQALQEEKAAGVGYLKSNVSNGRTNDLSSEDLMDEGESLGREANRIQALEQALQEKENRIKALEQALQEEKAVGVGYLKSNVSNGRTNKIPSENLIHVGESLGSEANTIEALEHALQEEKATGAALCEELEEERAAADSAADEAMAMILRLQDEKASLEMEAKQYGRMMEERFEYGEEEISFLKEKIVELEEEMHILKKELEAYKQQKTDAMGNDFEGEYEYDLEGKSGDIMVSSWKSGVKTSIPEHEDKTIVYDVHVIEDNTKWEKKGMF